MLLPTKFGKGNQTILVSPANIFLIAVNLIAYGLGRRVDFFPALTYAFVHANLWHLLGNMWVLWVFGNPVNRRLGNGWYLFVYLGTAVTIGLFFRTLLGINIVGASGAIFSIMAVGMLLLPGAVIEIMIVTFFPLSLLIGLFSRPSHWLFWFIRGDRGNIRAMWGLIFVPILELGGLFWWGWNWTNVGHLLGLVCGVAAVLILPSRLTLRRSLVLNNG